MVFVSRKKALKCRLLKILFSRSIFFPKMNIFWFMKQLNVKVWDPSKYVNFNEFPTEKLQDTYPKIFVLIY